MNRYRYQGAPSTAWSKCCLTRSRFKSTQVLVELCAWLRLLNYDYMITVLAGSGRNQVESLDRDNTIPRIPLRIKLHCPTVHFKYICDRIAESPVELLAIDEACELYSSTCVECTTFRPNQVDRVEINALKISGPSNAQQSTAATRCYHCGMALGTVVIGRSREL